MREIERIMIQAIHESRDKTKLQLRVFTTWMQKPYQARRLFELFV